jgi:hypothetical protein
MLTHSHKIEYSETFHTALVHNVNSLTQDKYSETFHTALVHNVNSLTQGRV